MNITMTALLLLAGALTSCGLGASAQAAAPARVQPPPLALVGRVNLNTACLAELLQIPGVGPSKAQAIHAFRERQPFTDTRQLMRIKGIGPRTYRRMAAYVTVSAPTSLVLAAAPATARPSRSAP